MSNNRIKVTELDYNSIRENLKTFMKGQEKFSDYDFDGSALSTIIDVLAYNTHYNALYTNLAFNEMFLDSASKRSSVISIANNFGYTPRSCASSSADVRLTITRETSSIRTLFLPKFSAFQTTIENEQYNFYNIEDYIADKTTAGTKDTFTFDKIKLYEGTPQTQVFLCTQLNQRFKLPAKNIDLSTLTVTVQATGEIADFDKYTQAIGVLELNELSEVYYVKELDDGTYELFFGSNNLGKPIAVGNVVNVSYIITNKTLGNGARIFSYQGPGLGGAATVSTLVPSFGGRDSETIDEIKQNVFQSFYDQNRAVTVGDYRTIIKRLYSNADSVNVWGGEDADPPVYGKVFITVKPKSGSFLTPSEKAFIKTSLLKSKNVVSVLPEIVDPTFLELDVETTVYYNNTKTTRSANDIKLAVIESIEKYSEENIRNFNGIFRMSKFTKAIDDADVSIQSNITKFKLYTEVIPKFGINSQYKVNILNPIFRAKNAEEAFLSTGFFIDETDTVYYLDDDGFGNIRLFSIIRNTGNKAIKNARIGTIDYEKGIVDIKNLNILNLVDANFYFIFKTASFDVVSVRNQVVDIPLTRLKVNVIQDQSTNAGLVSGFNYKFTSSRE